MSGHSRAFRLAVGTLIDRLEGYRVSDDPRDKGGVTKFGISSKANPDLAHRIRALTLQEAIEVYHDRYWSIIPSVETLPPGVAWLFFQCVVWGSAQDAISAMFDTVGGATVLGRRRAPKSFRHGLPSPRLAQALTVWDTQDVEALAERIGRISHTLGYMFHRRTGFMSPAECQTRWLKVAGYMKGIQRVA